MNMNNNPTVEELATMVAILDDKAHSHKIWVSHDGEVHISRVPENEEHIRANAKFRYETLDAGNDYVGPNAAKDLAYVEKELNHLKRDWAKGAEGYIDF